MSTILAQEIGKASRLSDGALIFAINILTDYEVGTEEFGVDELTQELADDCMSVVKFLEAELNKRQARRLENEVWKVATEKGWDRNRPEHRAHIRNIIKKKENQQ